MVERTNSLTGEALLGCSQYPECRETQPLPEHIKLRRRGAIPLPGME
jgi:ssDNA-binding Zn-finger/Zn-ribbon topoisomerase 1